MTAGPEDGDRQCMRRITDIAQEPLETLLPIEGYEKMPLVSLEDAVEQLVPLLPRVQTYAHVAKVRCKKLYDDLTSDESASIALYTMGWLPENECLYVVLNATLRSKNRERLQPWFLYLRLLFNALFRLPSFSQTIFRGVKLDLSEQYAVGDVIEWWGFSSCTMSMMVLQSEMFLGKTGVRTMFTIECLNGKNISKHSYFVSEDEILLLPATQFRIIGSLDQGDLKLIHLQEITPRYPLLQPIPAASQQQISRPFPTYSSRIGINTKWKQNGLTVAGGNGQGNQLNRLSQPCGICVDHGKQCIYIADYANDRIVQWRFDTNNSQIVAGGNGSGDQINQLNCPTDVLVDERTDSLIICDLRNRRVVRWPRRNTTSGEVIMSDIDCYGLAMNNHGDFYVCDSKANEVKRWRVGEKNGTVVAGGVKPGCRLDQFDTPSFLFVDENQSVYVSDSNNHRVMKWMKGAKDGIVVAGGQGLGDNLNQLCYPKGLSVDHLGQVYVADSSNNRIMRWSEGAKEGQIIVGKYGRGQESNQLNYPTGLAFDRQDNLYVVDLSNNRVQKFEIDLN